MVRVLGEYVVGNIEWKVVSQMRGKFTVELLRSQHYKH